MRHIECVAIGLMLVCANLVWGFTDPFNRADSVIVGNGWTESGALSLIDPQIINNELRWVSDTSGSDTACSASVSRTLDGAVDIRVDMKIPTAPTCEPYMIFRIYDAGNAHSVFVKLTEVVNDGVQVVRIYYNGAEVAVSGVADQTVYHNYRFLIDPASGKVTVFIDGVQQWSSGNGAMGPALAAEIIARRWWRWHHFYADNFIALDASTPAACINAIESDVTIAGDVNHDCQVDMADLANLAGYWLDDESSVDVAPLSVPDGIVDLHDFGVIAGTWMQSVPLELFDDNLTTGVAVEEGTYSLTLNPAEEIVKLSVYIDAPSSGTVAVSFDDIMSLNLPYVAGADWYSLRIPYSMAKKLDLTWSDAGPLLSELRLYGRTPVNTAWPSSGVTTLNVSTSLNVAAAANCDVPFGVMCNFFEQGIVQGITDPVSRPEFIQRFQEAGIDGFRYPGGGMCYGYPPTAEAVPIYISAGVVPYGLHSIDDWSSPQDFFQFCKDAGITAWYQFDPGYWYDSANQQVKKVYTWDAAGDVTYVNNINNAAASAAALALYAHNLGVDVVLEIGNEDFGRYKASTFARICVAFSNAIRAAVPSARICLIGDGESWSDYTWADDFVASLVTRGMGEVNYSSRHCYLSGAGGTTPQEIGDNAVNFWRSAIQYQYTLNRWHDAGFTTAKQAMTEFNLTAGGYLTDNPAIEHSVGRALGDAQLACELYRRNISIFYHDLVRDDPYSTFFARLDYYPENSAGTRYHLYPEAAAVALTTLHGHGNIVYNGSVGTYDRIAISRHSDFAYITVINNSAAYKAVNVTLQNVTIDQTRDPEYRIFRAANADCSFFDYHTETGILPGSENTVQVRAYPFSVTAVKVYLQ